MKTLEVPDREQDFTADPVELFFDLSYVFAFSQLVGVLIHDPEWVTVGKAVLIFALLWLTWSQLTWAANAVPGNTRTARLVFLAATATSVPMAAAVSTAFGRNGLLFAIPVVILALLGLFMALEGARDESGKRQGSWLVAAVGASCAFLLVGAALDGQARVILWVIAVVIYVAGTFQTTGTDWMLRAGHFAERHALILIVALGEVIVAVGKPLVDSLEEGEGLAAESVLALASAGVFGCILWWAYFDRVQPALEHRLAETAGSARSTLARDSYTLSHLPIVAGVIAAAAGLEEATLHPNESLPLAFRLMLFGGLSLFLGGVGVAVFRTFRVIARERVIAIVAVGVLLFVVSDLEAMWLIVAVDLILVAALLVEHRRIEGPQTT